MARAAMVQETSGVTHARPHLLGQQMGLNGMPKGIDGMVPPHHLAAGLRIHRGDRPLWRRGLTGKHWSGAAAAITSGLIRGTGL